ncbi:hypothetical protein GCM10017567_51040 [Amycolatopsis bullii]|uniref:Uncharacterized protein n=1 Tax=Amycolatopsis bullii TaxID=941987 RepID=A0ABQ3KP30_9PSEU|nr:hypothetical protein GCM10017567_51040 [Amycolatopsis bullii]
MLTDACAGWFGGWVDAGRSGDRALPRGWAELHGSAGLDHALGRSGRGLARGKARAMRGVRTCGISAAIPDLQSGTGPATAAVPAAVDHLSAQ